MPFLTLILTVGPYRAAANLNSFCGSLQTVSAAVACFNWPVERHYTLPNHLRDLLTPTNGDI